MDNLIIENSYDQLAQMEFACRKLCIVTDSNVAPLYLDAVKQVLGNVPVFKFKAGEPSKHIGTVSEIYKFFLANKLDRRSVVVALGGGVVGDLAGFAAATYMRGIDVVQLPTTLLAQVDAGLGGKTGFDFEGVKNLIGAFHQPKLVYINLNTLNTLPEEEFVSGLGEVVKHGYIGSGNKEYYKFLRDNSEKILKLQPDAMFKVVEGSCKIKMDVVRKDEKESGLREILNFGHCVGHAIESLSGYTMAHGKCVSVGMCAALYMSGIKDDLIQIFNLPTSIANYNPQDILDTMYKDKKTVNDTLRIVLLKKIGEAYTNDTITQDKILESLNGICK